MSLSVLLERLIIHSPKNVSPRFFICKFRNNQREYREGLYYTAQKKFLLNFQNSQMKKRGETLFGDCMEILQKHNLPY